MRALADLPSADVAVDVLAAACGLHADATASPSVREGVERVAPFWPPASASEAAAAACLREALGAGALGGCPRA